jgi:predicted RNA binding protein YcfA (HicA-like mRNA interferase family)
MAGAGPDPAFVAGSVGGMKVKAVIAALESDGWTQVRVTGSHRQFHHPSKPGTVTVAGKPNVDLPPGTLNSVLKQAGLKK